MSNNSKPASQTYQPRKATELISALGALMMIVGLLSLVFGIIEMTDPGPNNIPGIVLVISGIGCIIFAALLYIIANLSEDVHRLTYDVIALYNDNIRFHKNISEQLQEVDRDHDAIKKGIATISGKLQQ